MQTFQCARCGNGVHFENDRCLFCASPLGFDVSAMRLETLTAADDAGALSRFDEPAHRVAYCDNAAHGVCNWLRAATANAGLCIACGLNRTIPNLAEPGNVAAWSVLEHAKKRLVYSLLRFGLPLGGTPDVPRPLTFDFPRDATTGHLDGVVTIDVNETDPVERERQRTQLDESYRTVLGHMRHEVGHYYWMVLVDGARHAESFRALFGDERADYAAALASRYASGPAADWQANHVSSYASVHPWEDWSETWAHYLHMVDALDTAEAVGMEPRAARFSLGSVWSFARRDVYRVVPFDELMERWVPLTMALNSINRSMGHSDFYPFVISEVARSKLAFVHRVVREAGGGNPG